MSHKNASNYTRPEAPEFLDTRKKAEEILKGQTDITQTEEYQLFLAAWNRYYDKAESIDGGLKTPRNFDERKMIASATRAGIKAQKKVLTDAGFDLLQLWNYPVFYAMWNHAKAVVSKERT